VGGAGKGDRKGKGRRSENSKRYGPFDNWKKRKQQGVLKTRKETEKTVQLTVPRTQPEKAPRVKGVEKKRKF